VSHLAHLYAIVMYLSHVLNFVIDEYDFDTVKVDTVVSVCSSIFFPLDDMCQAILVLSVQLNFHIIRFLDHKIRLCDILSDFVIIKSDYMVTVFLFS
jgi:hypothetical protein